MEQFTALAIALTKADPQSDDRGEYALVQMTDAAALFSSLTGFTVEVCWGGQNNAGRVGALSLTNLE